MTLKQTDISRVEDHFKDLILRGGFAPGDRLPSTRSAAGELDVHYLRVAEAYKRLAEDGLVIVRPGAGAFVKSVESRREYLVCVGLPRGKGTHASDLAQQLTVVAGIRGLQASIRLLLTDHQRLLEWLGVIRQMADRRKLGGVWTISIPQDWKRAGAEVLSPHGVPIVDLSSDTVLPLSLGVDFPGGIRQGTQWLAGRAQRIVMLGHAVEEHPRRDEAFISTCEALGVGHEVTSMPFREQEVPQTFEVFGREAMHAILSRSHETDGILIMDDHIGRGALLELLYHKTHKAKHMSICTFSRKGDSFPGVFDLPVARLELDEEAYAVRACEMMIQALDGRPLDQPTGRIPLHLIVPEVLAFSTSKPTGTSDTLIT